MEINNVSLPGEDFKKDIQYCEQLLTNYRWELNKGRTNVLNEYVNLLDILYFKLEGWITDELKTKAEDYLRLLKTTRPICVQFNIWTGQPVTSTKNSGDYLNYIKSIDELEKILRTVMRDKNFLVKVSEKRLRLS